MIARLPYVVVIATPSRGVGQSTLASNLAVYLKGLVEDLPVAYVSCDAAATEAMFALSGSCAGELSELQQQAVFSDLLAFGEFGVEFCYAGSVASEPSSWLRKKLARTDYDGILILDLAKGHLLLKPALWTADLVLVPIKDPAALGEVVALRKELQAGGGCAEQFWLLPSELGADGRYRRSGQLTEFLRFAADERSFQVLGETFVADQRVSEQAAAKAKPVLTRVPESLLHQQLLQLAKLVLNQRQQQSSYSVRVKRWLQDDDLPARASRVELVCPLCQQGVLGSQVHYLESYPTRQRILLHGLCLDSLLKGTGAEAFMASAGLLLIQPGVARGGTAAELRLQTLDPELELLNTDRLTIEETVAWEQLLRRATGRHLAELYRERLLVSSLVSADEALSPEWYRKFVTLRRRLREHCREEKI